MNTTLASGNETPGLLKRAAAIATSAIILLEDLETPWVSRRNKRHDKRGIFRSDEEWKSLFRTECVGWKLAREGWGGERVWIDTPKKRKRPPPKTRGGKATTDTERYAASDPGLCVEVAGNESRAFQKWYVLEPVVGS